MHGVAEGEALAQVLAHEAVYGAGRVAAEDRVADDEVVRLEDGAHELGAQGAAVHEGDVVRKGEVLLHPFDAAHADAFVGEKDVAHAENENALVCHELVRVGKWVTISASPLVLRKNGCRFKERKGAPESGAPLCT